MALFANTLKPTPFGIFDDEVQFQNEADAMVTFVKRKMGDDILSVELTRKQVWACFEESFLEYGSLVNQYQAASQLTNLIGAATGSDVSGMEQKFPRENLEFLMRRAEPYAMEAGLGGSYHSLSGSIALQRGRQDYDILGELKDAGGNLIYSGSENNPPTRLKVLEVFHFSPQAAYRFFDTTSALNYLNNEFSFESFTPETVFYVLPVFEDVLRGGQLKLSQRIRRSNFSYKITGTKIRIYPQPTQSGQTNLFIRVGVPLDPLNPSYKDDTIQGMSNLSNIPFGNLKFARVNSIGRQWTRQYTLALSKELLGLVRSKFATVPIPGGDLQLNGADLIAQGREEQTNLRTELKEMLDSMTYGKILEDEANSSEALLRILKNIPMPNGLAISMG